MTLLRQRWLEPDALQRSTVEIELAKNPDLPRYIPRQNNGAPKKLDAKTLPEGVTKGSKQAELWAHVLKEYRQIINQFKSTEDRWRVALLIYKNLAQMKKLNPFPARQVTEADPFAAYAPMLDNKARRMVKYATETLGWPVNSVKVNTVEVKPECDLFRGVPCLRVGLSTTKRRGWTAPTSARALSRAQREELELEGLNAWELAPDGPLVVYLVERPRTVVVHFFTALPSTLKGEDAKVKKRVRETLRQELSKN